MIAIPTRTLDIFIDIGNLSKPDQFQILADLELYNALKWQTPPPDGKTAHYHLSVPKDSVDWFLDLIVILHPYDVSFGYSILQKGQRDEAVI